MLALKYFRALINSMEHEWRIKHFQTKKKKLKDIKDIVKNMY